MDGAVYVEPKPPPDSKGLVLVPKIRFKSESLADES